MDNNSFIKDFYLAIFKPNFFYENRFTKTTSKKIFALSFFGITLGIIIGGIFSFVLSSAFIDIFTNSDEIATLAKIEREDFIGLLSIQKSYSFLIVALAPLLALLMPHLWSGAFYFWLWLFKNKDIKLEFDSAFLLSQASLTRMIFFGVPIFGPFLALITVASSFSKGLKICYSLPLLTRLAGIMFAIYFCFFLVNTSLHMLASSLVKM